MKSFNAIYEEAVIRQGGVEAVDSRLPVPAQPDELRGRDDAYYLGEMSRRIFRAGLKHSMVDAKWSAFEQVFHGFNIERVCHMSDEELEQLMHDKRIIRHWAKIKAVRNNAQTMQDILQTHDSVGSYFADWPVTQIVDLWLVLKEDFSQLGGMSGPYFLRMIGKDTFILTDDVIKALIKWNALDRKPSGRKSLDRVQECMNEWSGESRYPLCQVSMILALSTG